MKCQSCDSATINGVYSHELGCPDAWQQYLRECRECGVSFQPEARHQKFCHDSCYAAYHGLDEELDADSDDFSIEGIAGVLD